ncbi:MAG: sterol desaturase family protein [Polyangiales bacterium]
MIAPLPFLAGALAWSTSEYVLHRFVGHGPRRRRPAGFFARLTPSGVLAAFNEEHLAHHADPSYFAPTSSKVAAMLAVVGASTAITSVFLGPRRGFSFGLGFGMTYAAYEILHRRIHTHPPRGRYGRWMRRHHLFHHHKAPRANHGVTSALWDKVFGTEEQLPETEPLRVPRKAAPSWLLDPETGEVRSEHRSDYAVGAAAR